jgi:hypothetical protein
MHCLPRRALIQSQLALLISKQQGNYNIIL